MIRCRPARVAVALIAFASHAFCQSAAQPAAASASALPAVAPPASAAAAPAANSGAIAPQGVIYKDGQLTIDVVDGTLVDILRKVSSLTGIRIDIPMEANGEQIPMIKLGPGTAPEVLASLLRDTHFNFLIAASDKDAGKLQSVLIMPADTKDTTAGNAEAPPPPRAPKRPFGAAPEQEASVAARAENGTRPMDAGASNPPPQGSPDSPAPASPSVSPDGGVGALASVANQADVARPATLSPPPVLNQETISQQLQQMYQQRMQMIQQGRQTGNSSAAAGN